MFSLDATGSSDPDGDPLTFAWTVISGEPPLRLSSATSETPRVTAPMVDEETVFVLRLRVSDGRGSDGDEMRVRVLPGARIVDGGMMAVDGDMMPADGGGDGAPRMLPQVGGGGCSCRIATGAGERGRSHGGLWLLGAIAVWVARGSRRPRRRR
jgi:hypothetical protein